MKYNPQKNLESNLRKEHQSGVYNTSINPAEKTLEEVLAEQEKTLDI